MTNQIFGFCISYSTFKQKKKEYLKVHSTLDEPRPHELTASFVQGN